jgi:hypothetical protein
MKKRYLYALSIVLFHAGNRNRRTVIRDDNGYGDFPQFKSSTMEIAALNKILK